ncbi:hypothetical protein PoB_007266300 [Plakobranchus ocellatus]|uniref:Uncharacterized protein n=1 Tax=Plakobranchus ocellatus TaxID=259542 RepID=A0AAV4DPA2_9GAST|nr:hypothetical protein PoB_007266300 [Plakobranchus ocellatus]
MLAHADQSRDAPISIKAYITNRRSPSTNENVDGSSIALQRERKLWISTRAPSSYIDGCYLAPAAHVDYVDGVGGTVANDSALRCAGTLLSRVRAPPPMLWPDGGPESLRSPCCGLAIYKNQTDVRVGG